MGSMNEDYDEDVVEQIKYLKTIHRGYKNLFISGALPVSSNVVGNLKEHNITIVVSLTKNKLLSLNDPRIEKANIVRFHYEALDSIDFDISKWFNSAYNDLYPYIYKKTPPNILIHCNEGKSRSTALLISIVLNMFIAVSPLRDDVCYTDLILEHVRMERKNAEPNSGFMRLLYEYEKKLKGLKI